MAEKKKMICPNCGAEMNHHAEKIDYTAALDEPQAAERIDPYFGGVVDEVHSCAGCGSTATRRASS
jgi:C4-type Zn-finger protein